MKTDLIVIVIMGVILIALWMLAVHGIVLPSISAVLSGAIVGIGIRLLRAKK
ncbi:MAG: hypothetical protein VB051_09850 [Candidatus Pelethousia sp.]|nr:hypothetical protein [Candidatus Pelethousia sp.]